MALKPKGTQFALPQGHEDYQPEDPGPYNDSPEWLAKRKALENHARIRNLLGRTPSGELWPYPKQ